MYLFAQAQGHIRHQATHIFIQAFAIGTPGTFDIMPISVSQYASLGLPARAAAGSRHDVIGAPAKAKGQLNTEKNQPA